MKRSRFISLTKAGVGLIAVLPFGALTTARDGVNLPIVAVQPGVVYGIQTADGGFAKAYFASATQGLALHANANGTYAF